MVVHVEFKKRIFTCNFKCIFKIVNEGRNAITNAENYEYLCSLMDNFALQSLLAVVPISHHFFSLMSLNVNDQRQ